MVGEKVSSDVVRNAVRDAVSMNYPDVRLVYQAVAESNITIELSLDGLSGMMCITMNYHVMTLTLMLLYLFITSPKV